MNTTNFIGAGVLLYAEVGNKIYFLLGKENKGNNKKRNNLYADFGGRKEGNEKPHQTAYREFVEESMNAFGRNKFFKKSVKNPTLIFEHTKYFEYVIKIEYNEDIPNTYNRLYDMLGDCMSYRKYRGSRQLSIKSCPHGLLEKSKFKWFTKEEILNNKSQFRPDFHNMFKRLVISLESVIKNSSNDSTKQSKISN